MNMMLLLVIYAVAIVGYVVFSRRRQAKAQEDRFAGLAKGAEGVFLTFDLSRSIMKVITPAPSTETAETVKETIVEEDSAIESADEK